VNKTAIRFGLLTATCLMIVTVPIAFTTAPAQAQSLYVQVGPGYGPGYGGYGWRTERFCRAAYWRRDWQAMRWCRWHSTYAPSYPAYGPYYRPYQPAYYTPYGTNYSDYR
jgi:hypothetical protein